MSNKTISLPRKAYLMIVCFRSEGGNGQLQSGLSNASDWRLRVIEGYKFTLHLQSGLCSARTPVFNPQSSSPQHQKTGVHLVEEEVASPPTLLQPAPHDDNRSLKIEMLQLNLTFLFTRRGGWGEESGVKSGSGHSLPHYLSKIWIVDTELCSTPTHEFPSQRVHSLPVT